MNASISIGRPEGLRQLPSGSRVKDQAEASRSAAFAFVWCAQAWGRRELALWLVGPYTRAVAATREPIRRRRLEEGESLVDETVRDVIRRSHAHVTELLRTCSTWGDDAGFERAMSDRGLVARICDDEWTLGYAPISRPAMGLADRVSSLFIADYLTRPSDYDRFRICGGCGGATFDHHNEHAETCGDAVSPAPASAVRLAVPRPALAASAERAA